MTSKILIFKKILNNNEKNSKLVNPINMSRVVGGGGSDDVFLFQIMTSQSDCKTKNTHRISAH